MNTVAEALADADTTNWVSHFNRVVSALIGVLAVYSGYDAVSVLAIVTGVWAVSAVADARANRTRIEAGDSR